MPDNTAPPQAIILAAGKGTRMGGDRAKVLYEVADEPMVRWVVKACLDAGVERCIVVIGYQGEKVCEALSDVPQCTFVHQTEQLGTGHAARMAEPFFEPDDSRDVFILAGDGPLIRPATLAALLDAHRTNRAAATLATAVLDDPSGYGRVIRAADGSLQAIVEQKDATPDQLAVNEVNPSYYCFRSADLFDGLSRITDDNQQGEYYLTDVPGILGGEGKTVALVDAVPAEDVLSINTPAQLQEVDRILRNRLGAQTPGERA